MTNHFDTVYEEQRLLQTLEGAQQLLAKRLYGSGLRVKEGLNLRVKHNIFYTQLTPKHT